MSHITENTDQERERFRCPWVREGAMTSVGSATESVEATSLSAAEMSPSISLALT